MADSLTKNRDIRSLTHLPIRIRAGIHSISFRDLFSTAFPAGSWQWADQECSPPLGGLRSTLRHHRVLAYRSNRDHIRARRGGGHRSVLPQSVGATSSWLHRVQPLRKRVLAIRTPWDLRWHGENRAVVIQCGELQVNACPISPRFLSQAHVLCDCPRTTSAQDLTIAFSRIPPGFFFGKTEI